MRNTTAINRDIRNWEAVQEEHLACGRESAAERVFEQHLVPLYQELKASERLEDLLEAL